MRDFAVRLLRWRSQAFLILRAQRKKTCKGRAETRNATVIKMEFSINCCCDARSCYIWQPAYGVILFCFFGSAEQTVALHVFKLSQGEATAARPPLTALTNPKPDELPMQRGTKQSRAPLERTRRQNLPSHSAGLQCLPEVALIYLIIISPQGCMPQTRHTAAIRPGTWQDVWLKITAAIRWPKR